MTGGLPPAPRWAWIVMALGVVAIVGLSYLALNRPPPPRFTAPGSADATEPTRPAAASTSAAPTTTPAEPARVLVVGDGLSSPPAAEIGTSVVEGKRAGVAGA